MKHTAKRILCLILTLIMCFSLLPIWSVDAAALTYQEAMRGLPDGSLAQRVLTRAEYTLDLGSWSTSLPLGAGHLQGICSDDEGKYMYASFTNMMVKVDMVSGKVVGTVVGMAAGSISGGAHIGDICYYDGKIYGSMEYKSSRRWYICVFDGDKITDMNMPYTTPGLMYALYVPQVGDDFQNVLDSGENNMVSGYNNAKSMGHRYGTGGIDGITFGTLPGKGYDTDGDGVADVLTGDKRYMIVAHGPYANAKRYDNENFVFLVFDPDDITSANLIPFTEKMLTADYTEDQLFHYKHKMFCYAGNQMYGVQQLEYDEMTGDFWMECYTKSDGSEFPAYTRYLIDGSVPLYMDTVEVGQSVTGNAGGFIPMAAAHKTASLYTDYEDGDGDGDTAEQEMGWHMTLKCLCGKGKTMADHEAVIYGATGKACKNCGKKAQFSTGLRSLGNDFFYGASSGSKTVNGDSQQHGTAYLYKLNRTTYTFEKVSPEAASDRPKLLMSYTMDAADTYIGEDGSVYIKDVSGNGYDAAVQGTYAAAGVSGKAGTAIGFRGNEYGSVVDRVYVTEEGMKFLNKKVDTAFSYSFWMYNQKPGDRFTPIIGMYRDTSYATGLYQGVIEMRYRDALAVVAHKLDNPADGKLYDGESYERDPGDGCQYIGGGTNGRSHYGNMGVFNEWQHVVLIRSGSDVTVYVNGVRVTSATDIGSGEMKNLSAFEIGGFVNRNWVDSNVRTRYTGLIDDVRIYAGRLQAADVAALYRGGKGAADSTADGFGALSTDGTPTFAAYSGEILPEQENPIVHLCMDRLGSVRDYSFNGMDAMATDDVTLIENREGQKESALAFDGFSQVKQTALTMSDENTAWLSAQLNATCKMTIAFWMKADFENSHRMSILGVYGKDGRPIGVFETRGKLGQNLRMDGRFAIAFTSAKPYDGAGILDEATYEQLAVTDTEKTYTVNNVPGHYGNYLLHQWYFIVGELDEINHTMSLYVNGHLIETVAVAQGTMDEIGYFMVGQPATRYYEYENAANPDENHRDRQGWAMRDGFVGALDEVRIYNTLLGEEKIAALYAAGTKYDTSLLVQKAAEAEAEIRLHLEAAQAAVQKAEIAVHEAEKAAQNARLQAEHAKKMLEALSSVTDEAREAVSTAETCAQDALTRVEAARAAAQTVLEQAELAEVYAAIGRVSYDAVKAAIQKDQKMALDIVMTAVGGCKEVKEVALAAAKAAQEAADAAAAALADAQSAAIACASLQEFDSGDDARQSDTQPFPTLLLLLALLIVCGITAAAVILLRRRKKRIR